MKCPGLLAVLFMVATFQCGFCQRSFGTAQAALRHQAQRARASRSTTYNRLGKQTGAAARKCLESGVQRVEHQRPAGLLAGRVVLTWAVAPVCMQSCVAAKAVSHDRGTPTPCDRDDSPTREEQEDMMDLACPSPCASMTVCSADNQM